MKTLSIVIANYNYAEYVSAAIESALAVDWHDLDVVVVDDGSTDDSRSVISHFTGSITTVFTANRGQREAVNTGYAASRGDVVIFLDADDTLPPDVGRAIHLNWRPGVSKWQFLLQPVDEDGRVIGSPFPALDPAPHPALMRHWLMQTSAYPTPPGSGNAYARDFLDEVLPAGAALGSAADSALLVAAPLYGEVVVVPSVVVRYRRHASNDSNLLDDPSARFTREVTRAKQRWAFGIRFATHLTPPVHLDPLAWRRSRELLQFRCVAWRLGGGEGGAAAEPLSAIVVDLLRSPWVGGPERWTKRLLVVVFCAAVLCSPPRLVPRLLARRFNAR